MKIFKVEKKKKKYQMIDVDLLDEKFGAIMTGPQE